MSSNQNEHTLEEGGGGREGCSKTNKGEKGGGESKLGNLERTYFLNVPLVNYICKLILVNSDF